MSIHACVTEPRVGAEAVSLNGTDLEYGCSTVYQHIRLMLVHDSCFPEIGGELPEKLPNVAVPARSVYSGADPMRELTHAHASPSTQHQCSARNKYHEALKHAFHYNSNWQRLQVAQANIGCT